MWKVIVCDGDAAEREQLIDLARQCLQGKEAQVTGCTDWPELDGMVKQALPDAVIVAQDGVEGLNTITSAEESSGFPIWTSVCRHTGCVSRSFAGSRYPAKRWSRQFPGL